MWIGTPHNIKDQLLPGALTAALVACCGAPLQAGRSVGAVDSVKAQPPAPPAYDSQAGGDITPRADVNRNGIVDFPDLQRVMHAYGSRESSSTFDEDADVNEDGLVNFMDLQIVLVYFGSVVSTASGDLLHPGNGFSGPTQEPGAIGHPSMEGYGAQAIARWDVVPYQEFDGELEIGVVAFHRNGIDRVEFSAEGGEWVAVEEMTENPRTGVWEYWITIDASEFEDGLAEIRAIAYPEGAGEPRLLEPLILNANGGGSWGAGDVYVAMNGDDYTGDGSQDRPYRTIWGAMQSYGNGTNIDGANIYLGPGVYAFGGATSPRPVTESGWVTVTAAPGVDPASVRLVATTPENAADNRFRIGNLRLSGLAFDQTNGWQMGVFSFLDPMLWLDGVLATGPGDDVKSQFFRHQTFSAVYVTESEFASYSDGCQGSTIARGVTLRDIGSDAFGDSRLVLDCRVLGITGGGEDSTYHPDVYQFSGSRDEIRENTIVFGLEAYDIRAQGIFFGDLAGVRDIAFVNVLIEHEVWEGRGPDDPPFSQFLIDPAEHILLWHVSLVNQEFRFRRDEIRDLSVRGSVFHAVRAQSELGGADEAVFNAMGEWVDNHYTMGPGYSVVMPGEGFTTGDPMYVNPAAKDYRPHPNSPLVGRTYLVTPIDANGAQRGAMASCGALEQ